MRRLGVTELYLYYSFMKGWETGFIMEYSYESSINLFLIAHAAADGSVSDSVVLGVFMVGGREGGGIELVRSEEWVMLWWWQACIHANIDLFMNQLILCSDPE